MRKLLARVPNRGVVFFLTLAMALSVGSAQQQIPSPASSISFEQQGEQLVRQGNLAEALSLYEAVLKTVPTSQSAMTGAAVVLDLMGRTEEARTYLRKAIDGASNPFEKINAERVMAVSWAFSGKCDEVVAHQVPVVQASAELSAKAAAARDAARACLDAGQSDTAYQWFLTAHDLASKQQNLDAAAKALVDFNWLGAQAEVAARKGNRSDADRYLKAAKALVAEHPDMAADSAALVSQLEGYLAFYRGDDESALTNLQNADQDDASVRSLMGQLYERSGQKNKAIEQYTKAASATAHTMATASGRPFAAERLAGLTKKDHSPGAGARN